MGRELRRVASGGAEVALLVPSDPTKTILRRVSMARKFARILLATLFAVALGGITACGDSGPAEQAEQAADKMGEAVSDMGDAAKEMDEAAEEMLETEEEENQ
jgi:hypothetical protein